MTIVVPSKSPFLAGDIPTFPDGVPTLLGKDKNDQSDFATFPVLKIIPMVARNENSQDAA